MLDAFLAGAACLGRRHRIRYMTFEWYATLFGLVGDCEVSVARQPAVDLDEILSLIHI